MFGSLWGLSLVLFEAVFIIGDTLSLNICEAGSFFSAAFSISDTKLWPDTNEFCHSASAPFSIVVAQMHYQILYTQVYAKSVFSKKDPIFTANQIMAVTEMYITHCFCFLAALCLDKKLTVHQLGLFLETK